MRIVSSPHFLLPPFRRRSELGSSRLMEVSKGPRVVSQSCGLEMEIFKVFFHSIKCLLLCLRRSFQGFTPYAVSMHKRRHEYGLKHVGLETLQVLAVYLRLNSSTRLQWRLSLICRSGAVTKLVVVAWLWPKAISLWLVYNAGWGASHSFG